MLMYGRRVNNDYVINSRGERLARLIARRVSEANDKKRSGLHLHAEGLVAAIDILREVRQWTAVGALIEFYDFSEQEFTEAEYASDRMAS